jgi:hypothetical protein
MSFPRDPQNLVHPTLAISCEGRTTSLRFTMTLPMMMLPHGSNRPSSAASRCWMAPSRTI